MNLLLYLLWLFCSILNCADLFVYLPQSLRDWLITLALNSPPLIYAFFISYKNYKNDKALGWKNWKPLISIVLLDVIMFALFL